MMNGQYTVFKINISILLEVLLQIPQATHINHPKEYRHNQMSIGKFVTVITFIGFCKKACQFIICINIGDILFFCRIISLWKNVCSNTNGIQIFCKLTKDGSTRTLVCLCFIRLFYCTSPIQFPL